MSRSFKHKPHIGNTTSESEKEDKKRWHSALRVKERGMLSEISITTTDEDYIQEPNILDVSNVATFDKDGKHYFDKSKPENQKLLRK